MPSPPYDPQRVRHDRLILLRVALARAAIDVRRPLAAAYPAWQDVPGLIGQHAMLTAHLRGGRARRPSSFDPHPTLRAMMARCFPTFVEERNTGTIVPYAATVGEAGDAAMVLTWSFNRNPGLTPSLGLTVGLQPASGPRGYRLPDLDWSVPHLFGRGDTASWAYGTPGQLEEALGAAADLLGVLLPALAEAARGYLSEGERTIDGAGGVTARGALGKIDESLRAWDAGAELTELIGAVTSTAEFYGPAVAGDGRLRVHARWNLRVCSEDGSRHATAHVPSVGPAEFLPCDEPQPWLPSSRAGAAWIDSDEAVRVARSRASAADWPEVRGLMLKGPDPARGRSMACWDVGLGPRDSGSVGRNVVVDAVDARVLEPAG